MTEDKFLPDGFKTRMISELGRSRAEILLSALSGQPEISLRLNRRKSMKEEPYDDLMPVPWCMSGRYLQERPQFTFHPLLHAGAFYVQDASSMIYENIIAALSDGTPMVAADLCAAPGGKTTAILNALPDGSTMLANEFIASRAAILKENLCKYGYPDIIVTNTDVARLAPMQETFDLVAVDAPCSGEGMMRKEEAARKQWSEGLINQCASLQREILASAVEMIAPGGYLIYSTCTFNTSEDEDNAAWIADKLGLTPVDTGLAGCYGIEAQVKGSVPCLRFLPGFVRGEGLFVAVFQKDGEKKASSTKKKTKKLRKTAKIDPMILATAKSWISTDAEIHNHEGHLMALNTQTEELLNKIPKGVRILSAGIELGEIKGKDLIPAHALAMSVIMSHSFPEVEVTEDDAIHYLSRESVVLPYGTPKGFILITFKGLPLGFIKNHGNRANNLYPQEYRIRTRRQF